jgi:radical SAM superfamily enzyme YgiQ (UPF0313 family)
MLDLAGCRCAPPTAPPRDPLVIAGGSGCYNPEPMSAFFDAMIIGEGEEVIFEVIAAYEEWNWRLSDWRLAIGSLGASANLQSPIHSPIPLS